MNQAFRICQSYSVAKPPENANLDSLEEIEPSRTFTDGQLEDHSGVEQLTDIWRREAIFQLYKGITVGSRDNGTRLHDCWVPVESVNSATGEILDGANTYQKIRIRGKNYQAHVAMLILIHGRFPLKTGDKTIDEVGMHMCNNPACRNPYHLKFGTRQDDSDHKVACGRAPSGVNNGHSTRPDRTPRGPLHYNCRLREADQIRTANELLKKYGHQRGSAAAIANHLRVSKYTIDGLKRKKEYLDPSVAVSEIELEFSKWTRIKDRKDTPKNTAKDRRRIASEIRRHFHACPDDEKSGLLIQFKTEYGYSQAWIRKILKRDYYPEVEPEIPVPTYWGPGRRRSPTYKRKKVSANG